MAQLRLTDDNVPEFLRDRGIGGGPGGARVEAAGDGNINWVRRVRFAGSPGSGPVSVVVKQARPALERFPEYQVTTERIVFEARYYEVVAPFDRAGLCPRVLAFDEGDRVLVLEDLGDAPRLDAALACGPPDAALGRAAEALGAFLGAVHRGTRDAAAALGPRFANDAMRRLHGDHIFALPLRPNDFPLAPRLRARAEALWRDAELVAVADAAYARYLAPGAALVHADVQSGNVLLTAGGPKLLDAEIAHVGDPAFDLGTLVAHLAAPSIACGAAGDADPLVAAAWRGYRAAGGDAAFADASRYAGLEMLRRAVGAARMRATQDAAGAERVLEAAVAWIREPAPSPGALR